MYQVPTCQPINKVGPQINKKSRWDYLRRRLAALEKIEWVSFFRIGRDDRVSCLCICVYYVLTLKPSSAPEFYILEVAQSLPRPRGERTPHLFSTSLTRTPPPGCFLSSLWPTLVLLGTQRNSFPVSLKRAPLVYALRPNYLYICLTKFTLAHSLFLVTHLPSLILISPL